MAIKGYGYTKTSWAFEERPVASAKLNLWDDRIEGALELLHFLVCMAWGGGDGVIRGAADNDLSVGATAPVSMAVTVQPGYAFISRMPYKLAAAVQTLDVAAPASNPRRDVVQARLTTWDVSVKTGTEAAEPVAPDPDADCLALAHIYCRPGMTSIKNADDSTNGYVTDVRAFV